MVRDYTHLKKHQQVEISNKTEPKTSSENMNCKVIYGSGPQLCFHEKNYHLTKKSTNLGFSASCFGSKLKIPSLHANTASGQLRIRAMATCNINTFSVSTESTETLYDLLGISKNGTISEIKKAYKELARKYHPDVSPRDRVEEHTRRFIMANEAYDTLSDPQRRQIYDADLANRSYPFAFSARNGSQYDERIDDIGEWSNMWQSQVQELKRKSMSDRGKHSAKARMRRQT